MVVGISLALFPEGIIGSIIIPLQNFTGLIAGSILGVMFLHIGPRNLFDRNQPRQVITKGVWFLAVLILFLLIISFLL